MAGIGLQLHRLVASGTYLGAATAYLSSTVITAGPWLSPVVALSLLGGASVALVGHEDRELLFATIMYSFGLSLVATGGLQLVVTRYLADRFYAKATEAVAPACSAVLLCAIPLVLMTAPFVVFAPFDLRYRVLAASLFVTTSLLWLVSVFLSAARDYRSVVLVLVAGYTLSLGAGVALTASYGLLGGLGGFLLGQTIALPLLVARVYREFPSNQWVSLAVLGYARRFWDLFLIGLLYSAALWVDNTIYWFSADGVVVAGFYRAFPIYDTTKFVAYLSTIPAAAVFLVKLETNFYHHYRDFYAFIMEKGSLDEITRAQRGMITAFRSALVTLVKLEGFLTIGALIAAPELATLFRLPLHDAALLRVQVLAATGQFFLLFAIVLLLYLDERRAALVVALSFLVANAGLTLVTLRLGPDSYGVGYALAALTAGLLGLSLVNDRLTHLVYRTFMSQPMAVATPRAPQLVPALESSPASVRAG